ncbi:hypothetical protein Hypma_000754 [Hypsizygus marmoreus]|uniref:Uncharacterized protein n=1 Tax=Hypsizygus marmoreus TaxID=39966 RepID=A0A369J9F7_HYPMA|nr:hypothetical protein Hypma_000754 [Hypsizygus marmoreus]
MGKNSKAGSKGTPNSTKHVSQENIATTPAPQPRPKPRPVGRKRKRTDNQDASETENGVPQETAIERDETIAAATNLGEQHPLQAQQNIQEQPIAQRESRQRKQSTKAGVVLMWEKEEEAKRARKKAKASK